MPLASGCVGTAVAPELQQVTCPSHPVTHNCSIPARESENPVPELVLALACMMEHFDTYREEWEDCDE